MPTPEEMNQKKVSPNSVNDEDTKKYDNEVAMSLLAGDDDDVVDDVVVSPEDEKRKQQEQKEKELAEQKGKEDEESLDDIVDELLNPDKKKKEPEKKTTDEVKDDKTELTAALAEKDAKISELSKEIQSLKEKLNKFGSVQNVISELGFSDMNQNDLVSTMKDLKTTAFDYMRNPKFIDIIEGFATGKFKLEGDEEKPVSAFMPQGLEDEFDYQESMNDPYSHSWKARAKWEKARADKQREFDALMEKVNSYKHTSNGSNSELEKKFAESKKIMDTKLAELKQFAIDEYEDGEKVYENFLTRFKSMDSEIFKVAIAVLAKKNGKQSLAMKKITENKEKISAESETSKGDIHESGNNWDVKEDADKEYANTFTDWNDDLGVVQ